MKLLTNNETAALLGIKPNTLENWRTRGQGPRFLKLGKGKGAPIRYSEDDVLAWLSEGAYASTSAYSPAALANAKSHKCRSSEVSA